MQQLLPSPAIRSATIQPTARELRWFTHIDRHGPQSSEFLYECTRDTHRCRDTSLRRLQALREAGYLHLPPQQRQIAKADFNPYIYDLTQLGWEALSNHQDLERHCRPTGHWWHGLWVSAVTSAIEIGAAREEATYIPAAQILAIKGVDLAIPIDRTKLIPDQIFAIRNQEGFRAFALEVDRGTEPVRSNVARKSLQRSVQQYLRFLDEGLYKQHYGLKSNMVVLWCLNNARRRQQFEEVLPVDERRFVMSILDGMFPKFDRFLGAVDMILGL